MAVIAVGDFDAKAMEAMIVEHFSRLKNPPNAPPRPAPAVPDHADTLFSIETDPELSSTSVQILCKHPAAPDGSAANYRRDLVEGLYAGILNQRLSERVQEANPPYLGAGVGKSQMVRVKDLATQVAGVKDGLYAEGLKALLVESRRARRDGFTAAELERAQDDDAARAGASLRGAGQDRVVELRPGIQREFPEQRTDSRHRGGIEADEGGFSRRSRWRR